MMKREQRLMVYDEDLQLEAYHFKGLRQNFPEHFHNYYVLGLLEQGERQTVCNGKSRLITAGDIIIFNPLDNHTCIQTDSVAIDYRSFNISAASLLHILGSADNSRPPLFNDCVIRDEKIAEVFRDCHRMVMTAGNVDFDCVAESEKEELFLLLLSLLLDTACDDSVGGSISPSSYDKEIAAACDYIDDHFAENISLGALCARVGVSKSTLIRYFIRLKHVTPYRYLASVRVSKAQRMLEQGGLPVEVAIQSGFADQSHFNHCFKKFIGISPGMYREMLNNKI